MERFAPAPERQAEQEPRFHYRFLFSRHAHEGDLPDFAAELADADVYVKEGTGWSEAHQTVYRLVSEGVVSPDELTSGADPGFDSAVYSALYGSGKGVELIDIPEGDPLLTRLEEAGRDFRESGALFPAAGMGLEEMIAFARDAASRYASVQREREERMRAELDGGLKRRILDDYPHLRQKADIKVLLTLGSVHTGLYHRMEKDGTAVERAFSELPYTYSPSDEVLRGLLLGRPPGDDAIAASLLYFPLYLLYLYREGGTDLSRESASAYARFVRSLTARFSYADIRELFAGFPEAKDAVTVLADLDRRVQEKGLGIPDSPDVLDAATVHNAARRNSLREDTVPFQQDA